MVNEVQHCLIFTREITHLASLCRSSGDNFDNDDELTCDEFNEF